MTNRADVPSDLPDLPDICVRRFDGDGGAEPLTLAEIEPTASLPEGSGFTWIHLRLGHLDADAWLARSGLDPFVLDALTAPETRPRCTVHGDGVILNLRGVNLNPGAEPEDMVSIRLWVEGNRVVGTWLRPLLAVRDVLGAIERAQATGHTAAPAAASTAGRKAAYDHARAPTTPGELVAKLALRLADRAEPTVAAFNERIDLLEETILDEGATPRREHLAEVRRVAIVLRRYMFPQRDALTTLESEALPWLAERDRSRLREAAERVTRLAEDLDAIRDRSQVVHDQIMEQRADVMNRQMLVLSIVAAVFLPLGLLTGLLGVNVGGMPGTDDPQAFWIVCLMLLAITGGLVWFFRHIGLLK